MSVSTFPPPPPYYTLLRDSATSSPKTLAPPPPPLKDASFSMFGQNHTLEDAPLDLEAQGQKQLYAKGLGTKSAGEGIHTFKSELKRINKALRKCFVDVLDGIENAAKQNKTSEGSNTAKENLTSALERSSLTLINMQDLLNSFRPHQAREILIMRSRAMLAQTKLLTAQLKKNANQTKADMHTELERLKAPKTKSDFSPVLIIRVDGLPCDTRATDIEQFFAAFGCVCGTVNIVKSGMGGFGYVYFTDRVMAVHATTLVHSWSTDSSVNVQHNNPTIHEIVQRLPNLALKIVYELSDTTNV